MEAYWLIALPRKPTQQETKEQTIPEFREELGEGEAGEQRLGGNRNERTLQGLTGTWEKAKSGKGGGGGGQSWDTAEDAGTRCGAQRRVAESGWWWVAGVVDIHMVATLRQERRWGAGAEERGL